MRPGARALPFVLAALLVYGGTLAFAFRGTPHERGRCSEVVLHRETVCEDGRVYLLPEWRDIGPATAGPAVPR